MKKSSKLPTIILTLLLTLLTACATGGDESEDSSSGSSGGSGAAGSATPVVSLISSTLGTTVVQVELARTNAEQNTGLMGRDQLGEFEGMLFLFNSEAVRAFTMEGTFIPLDIIFIGRDFRIVGIVKNTIPQTPGPYSITIPSMYALEVNAGFSDRRQLEVGDPVVFSGFEF